MTIALIDADIVAYRAAAGAQIDWGDTVSADPRVAKNDAEATIRSWLRKSGCSDPILCFSDTTNFRKTLATDYKLTRPEKPSGYWDVVRYLEEQYKFIRWPGLEADDVMSILGSGTMPTAVVVSIDKDLKTAPVRLMNPSKDARPHQIRRFQADVFWMMQTLMGDVTDGYKGCPKIGPKKAEAILQPLTSLDQMWEAVVATYEAAELTEDDAILNARMARILRHEDYNQDTQEFRLWHPKSPTWQHPIPTPSKSEGITTSAKPYNPSNTSSPTTSGSARGTSSSMRRGGSTRAGSKTSRKSSTTPNS